MKKVIGLFLVLGMIFSALLIGGCGQGHNPNPTGTVVPDVKDIIDDLVSVNFMSAFFPGLIVQETFGSQGPRMNSQNQPRVDSVSLNGTNININNLKMHSGIPTPEYTSGWWTSNFSTTEAGDTSIFDLKVRGFDASNSEITTFANMANLSKYIIKLRIEDSTSMEGYGYIFGTDSRPLTLSGLTPGNTGTVEIDGAVEIRLTYSASTAVISVDYPQLHISDFIQPTSGTANFSVTGDFYVPISGTVTFIDTVESFVFSSPASFTGKTYYLFINDGTLTWEAR